MYTSYGIKCILGAFSLAAACLVMFASTWNLGSVLFAALLAAFGVLAFLDKGETVRFDRRMYR